MTLSVSVPALVVTLALSLRVAIRPDNITKHTTSSLWPAPRRAETSGLIYWLSAACFEPNTLKSTHTAWDITIIAWAANVPTPQTSLQRARIPTRSSARC